MRLSILVVVVVAAVAATPAAATLRPPVIRERWTPLPCRARASSTVEVEGCLERAIVRSDRRINKSAARIFRSLRYRSDRRAFDQGEQAWLRYRRRSCSAEASVYRGGSAEPVAFLACEKRRNSRHIADLVAMERTLRQG